MNNSQTRYPDDYQFVQLLLSGHTDAWDRFYKEVRKKIALHINNKYPSIFNEVMIDEICDGVQNRLTKSNYKVLREYRGDCSFSAFVTKATDWEVKDWLRKYSDKLFTESIDSDPTLGSDICISTEFLEYEEDIPEEIHSLSDDLRWAFLFRYYDYFGFPLKEIRKLAKKKEGAYWFSNSKDYQILGT